MVGSALTVDYFSDLLNSLYEHIEGIDCSGFAWSDADTDAFTRARVPMQWDRHLSCWIWLADNITMPTKAAFMYAGHVVYGCRYSPSNDDYSQAVINASARAVVEALFSHRSRFGRVTSIQAVDIEIEGPDWVSVDITFSYYQER